MSEEFKIEILNLKAEDVIVVKVNGVTSCSLINTIGEYYQNKFPKNKVVVIDDSIDISIIRKDKESEIE